MDIDRILTRQRLGVRRGTIDLAADGHSGVIDEDVEPAEVSGDVLYELFDVGSRCLVGLVGAGLDTLCLQLGDDGLRLVGSCDVADGNIGSMLSKRPRTRR